MLCGALVFEYHLVNSTVFTNYLAFSPTQASCNLLLLEKKYFLLLNLFFFLANVWVFFLGGGVTSALCQ